MLLLAISVGTAGCAINVAKPADDGAVTDASSSPITEAFGAQSIDQMLQSGVWHGSWQTSYDKQDQQLRTPNGQESHSGARLVSTSISIRNTGFALVDPRLLSGNLGLRFALQQNQGDTPSSGQKALLTDYSLDAVVLGQKPYNASLVATRTQGTNTLLTGGSSTLVNENRSVTLRLREDSLLRDKGLLPWFSANLRVARERSQEDTQVSDNHFRRDDERSLISFEAHNGFETADLDFRFDRTDYVNRIYAPGSYGSQSAMLGYSLDFGPNLTRRWDSRITYAARAGVRETSNISVDESLSVEHYRNLSSAYSYSVVRQATPEGTATTQSGGVNLRHRLYANLTTTLGLTGSRTDLPDGTRDSRAAQLNFSYSHGLPWQGQLSAALGGNVAFNQNQVTAGFVAVFETPYQAPPSLGAGAGFLLNDRFIVGDTIVILAIKGGARVPTTAGIDYLVVAEGDQTRILPQASSAIIQAGDVLVVSYQFQLDPNIRYRSDSRSLSLSADWGWVGAAVSHEESAERALSGVDSGSFLGDSRRDVLRLNVRRAWDSAQMRADATLTRYRDGNLDYSRTEFSQFLIYRPSVNWSISASAHEYRTEYVTPRRESVGSSIALNVDWLMPGGWRATANLSRRDFRDTKVPSETITEATLRLNRKWAKLSLNATLATSERLRGAVESNNVSIHFNIVRQF